jgi:Tfp pilus assembly protein PilO
MKTGPDRKVVFALLAIAALCVVGLGASLYRGKVSQLGRMKGDLADKKKQLADLHDKLGRQSGLEERYTQLQGQLAILEPSLPEAAYVPTFLGQIEGLALSTKNTIAEIRPRRTTKENRPAAVQMNDETGEITKDAAQKAPAGSEENQPKLPYEQVAIEFKIKGSYWSVIDFLSELQRFPKMIAVNDVSFTPERVGDDTAPSPELTATLDLTAVATKGGKHET